MRKLKIFDKDFTVYKTKISETYNKNITEMFEWMNVLKLNDGIIIDVGANEGIFSMAYSKMFTNNLIYSIEPINDTFITLTKNIKKNNLSNIIKLNKIAFSSKNEILNMSLPDNHQIITDNLKKYKINSGFYSIYGKNKKKSCKIKMISLDFFVKKNNLNTVDFIKIDVEGAEFEVLKGSVETIKKYKPNILFENIRSKNSNYMNKIKNIDILVSQFKYNIYGLGYGWKKKLKLIKNLQDKKNIDIYSDIFLSKNILYK